MSAVSFLTTVKPLGNESSGDTPTKDKKQENETRLKKGTVVFVKMMVLKGCVACWQTDQIQRNLISFVVWGEDPSAFDCGLPGWRTDFKKPVNETMVIIINGVFR